MPSSLECEERIHGGLIQVRLGDLTIEKVAHCHFRHHHPPHPRIWHTAFVIIILNIEGRRSLYPAIGKAGS